MQSEMRETDGLELKARKPTGSEDSEWKLKDLEVTEIYANCENADRDSIVLWVPTGRRLISGLVGINIVLLGGALVAGNAFHPLRHQEPVVFLMLLMALSVVWMLWYLLWARKQPGAPPHTDHHAGGAIVTVGLMLFAGCSLLLCVFSMVYNILMKDCQPPAKVILPFIQTPFLLLQTFLLWAHSKDCIHKHRVLTRSGLMVTLCTDIVLWLYAVTEDTIHLEIELEKQYNSTFNTTETDDNSENGLQCQCKRKPVCMALRKGYEILYPFNMEFSLLAGCMFYVMWKNVGRHVNVDHASHVQKLTFRIVHHGGILVGPVLGMLVLISGTVVFVLYQVWVSQQTRHFTAFLIFYGFHICVMPAMSLCSLAGTLLYRNKKIKEGGQNRRSKVGNSEEGQAINPTRSLDILLLLGAGIGQLSLSYFSLVAALDVGAGGILGNLDLSYSLLGLLELVMQNVFIIQGLHENIHSQPHSNRNRADADAETFEVDVAVKTKSDGQRWGKKAIKEISAFLILSNIMLWVIPAFGAHPQFESGVGKEFFGFSVWFVLVNLGQPLTVFYRMHSVGALMELLITA